MTTAQLIAILQTLPPDAEVLFDLGDEYITVATAEHMDAGDDHAALLSAATYEEEDVEGLGVLIRRIA